MSRPPDHPVIRAVAVHGRGVLRDGEPAGQAVHVLGRVDLVRVGATGNITNDALIALFEKHLDAIVTTLTEADFVELGPGSLVVHRRRKENPPS